MADAVTLTVPHARRYYGVVRLVVGGVAARVDLPYEHLEDVQLALESLLTNDAYAAGGDVTVEVAATEGGLQVTVGPLDGRALEPDLRREADESHGVDLHRLLTTLMGGLEVDRRGGADWVRMTKAVPRQAARAE